MNPQFAVIDTSQVHRDPVTDEYYYRAFLYPRETAALNAASQKASEAVAHDIVLYRPIQRVVAVNPTIKLFDINDKMEVIPK